ncbi:LysM peptidoglycan-binding domain-containing protein [Kocuria sp.]|uniref:LysM peptidoglycan-binding domain-containing protein n=1 Tax=Kocuria sp. TaxID=1871328 RepID=UPI0026E03F4D|nr:LysM peptidoglycan-binding domain-containing protein [Kocuria sp.]MDO5619585.1 LysM peptidoglycan-binding domain-containing protein [Kocuria sp.]
MSLNILAGATGAAAQASPPSPWTDISPAEVGGGHGAVDAGHGPASSQPSALFTAPESEQSARDVVSPQAPGTAGQTPSPFWAESQPQSAPPETSSRVVEGTVTVRAGESLWSITQELMGANGTDSQVANTWPYLWQLNAHLVADPDLLQPGTVLNVPAQLLPGAGHVDHRPQ